MKTLGIIAEYNPFHKGHEYALKALKEKVSADYCVVVMSGDYTQRGAPAIFDKMIRTEMALSCGADLVIELPIYYSTGSAEYFAGGALSILNGLNVIDYLGFGSESEDMDTMQIIAEILADEPEAFSDILKKELKSGKNYAVARASAISEYTGISPDIISASNDILGIEYLKAIKRQRSNILPVCIKRIGSGYHDDAISHDSGSHFSSAEGIRRMIAGYMNCSKAENDDATDISDAPDPDFNSYKMSGICKLLQPHIPEKALNVISARSRNTDLHPSCEDDFRTLLQARLLSEKPFGYDRYMDVTPGLSRRIISALPSYTGFSDFVMELKTKDITYTHISRALLHIMLGMTADSLAKYSKNRSEYASYARILGFRRGASPLMKKIQECSTIPVLSKLSDGRRMLDPMQFQLLNETIAASDIYDLITKKAVTGEYRKSVILL